MAWELPTLDISLPAGADLSGSQYLAVKVNSSGQAVLAGAGEAAIGVLQNKPANGQTAQVRVFGVTKMVAGGAIAVGTLVAVDATGKAKPAATGVVNTADAGATNDPVIGSHALGIALTAAAAANEIFSMALLHLGAVPTTAA